MSKKKLEEKSESVTVDVDTTVTSVTGVPVVGEPCVEMPSKSSKSKRKPSSSKVKKVEDIALETQIADMEQALENAKLAIESACADNERMADELDTAVAENKSLRKELSKCKQDYKKCQGDNRANSALVETLNGELTRLKVRNEELMGTISRLQDKIKEYAEELSVKDKDLEDLNFFNAMRAEELSEYKSMSLWQRIKFVFLKDKIFCKKK